MASNHQRTQAANKKPPPVYIVSGNVGALGEQAVRTILPQFPGVDVPIEKATKVRDRRAIEAVVDQAARTGGTIVHTLTNSALRYQMIDLARKKNVVAIDIVGPLIERLTQVLAQEPVGQPGLYRQMNLVYFQRVEAIDFTLAHDDGKNFQTWEEAEILLVGPSRVGKTPLGLFLSMQGWKVANVPLVPGVSPRQKLFELDRRRIIGLKIDPAELLAHRRYRQTSLGISGQSDYDDPVKLYEEVTAAQQIFRRGGFKVIDVTNKPIETSAAQVVTAVTRQLGITP
ncbi:MAG: kinase/pyrophosphorylase [Anaerolineae bacterium]